MILSRRTAFLRKPFTPTGRQFVDWPSTGNGQHHAVEARGALHSRVGSWRVFFKWLRGMVSPLLGSPLPSRISREAGCRCSLTRHNRARSREPILRKSRLDKNRSPRRKELSRHTLKEASAITTVVSIGFNRTALH